ncbi:MAG: hypothetical protein HKN47_02230 [Pirellulaceae bacterium]|nr:hypothetical protein [Pirellulaceae bacterium]
MLAIGTCKFSQPTRTNNKEGYVMDNNTNESNESDVGNAITNEKPLGEQVPGAPFAVVALTYLALLGALAIGAAFALRMFT